MTDARPTPDRRVIEESAETKRKRKLGLRMFAFCLALVGALGLLTAIVGQGGYIEMRGLRHDIALLRQDVEARRLAVRALEDERDRLQIDPLARERIARERLGLIRQGEIDFLLPREVPEVARRRG